MRGALIGRWILLALVLVVAGWAVGGSAVAAGADASRSRARSGSLAGAEDVSELLTASSRALERFAADRSVQRELREGDLGALQPRLARLLSELPSGLRGTSAMAHRDGRVVGSRARGSGPAQSLASRLTEGVAAVPRPQPGGVRRSLPVVDPATDAWVVGLEAPVGGDGGIWVTLPVEAVRMELRASSGDVEPLRLATSEGRVLAVADRPQAVGAVLGNPDDSTAEGFDLDSLANGSEREEAPAVASVDFDGPAPQAWYVLAPTAGVGVGWPDPLLTLLAFLSVALAVVLLRRGRAGHGETGEEDAGAPLDPLTGLPVRRTHQAQLEGLEVVNSPRWALLRVDLDRFTEVNEVLGRQVGDDVLTETGRRLLAEVRSSDHLARTGDDEFTVVLADLPNVDTARYLAQRLRGRLQEPFALDGAEEMRLGASVGIAVHPDHGTDPADLLRRSQTALRVAKRSLSGLRLYDPDLDDGESTTLSLATDLRAAIEQGQLWLAYQPIRSLRDRRVIGVEALARWEHPTRGAISPAQFIPVAEATGMIRDLTSTVVSEAVRAASRWRDAGHDLSMSINLSAVDLQDEGLPGRIDRVLREHGFPPSRLQVEVTETAVVDDPDGAASILSNLRDRGIRTALDDFGTGYSSLAYLTRLPLDVIKIDRSFVAGLLRTEADRHVTRMAIGLAQGLGLDVVAEGIEDEDVLLRLRQLGSAFGQGWHLGRPAPAHEIPALTVDVDREAPPEVAR